LKRTSFVATPTIMATWESERPPRSSRWQAPGIFFNVEIGVSYGSEDRTHTRGIQYMSRRMEERMHEERMRRNRGEAYYHSSHEPSELQQLATLGALMPGSEESAEYQEADRQARHQQQQRQRQLGVRIREQHERGTSAPPSLEDRFDSPPVSYIPHIAPIQHTQSMPLERTDSYNPLIDRTNQPLPPTPSQFRLGEDEMPWSMPAFYRSPDQPESAVPFDTSSTQSDGSSLYWEQPNLTEPLEQGIRENRGEMDDPQRVREREELHQAMMTVDSLPIGHGDFNPWTWDSTEHLLGSPRNLGWAVASRDPPSESRSAASGPAPPPYVVSQWERTYRNRPGRPMSAYS
jgi:hypothetical protein